MQETAHKETVDVQFSPRRLCIRLRSSRRQLGFWAPNQLDSNRTATCWAMISAFLRLTASADDPTYLGISLIVFNYSSA